MPQLSPAPTAWMLLLAGLVVGCSATDPYIYKPREFDRQAADFNKPMTDRDSLLICYNGWASSRATIDRIAEEECRRFGKTASRQPNLQWSPCPLLVPTAASFVCLAAGSPATDVAPSSPPPTDAPAID